jgi:hypothetical protein
MSSGVITLRRRISIASRPSRAAAASNIASIANTLAGRATPRYGPDGAVLVATPRTVQR